MSAPETVTPQGLAEVDTDRLLFHRQPSPPPSPGGRGRKDGPSPGGRGDLRRRFITVAGIVAGRAALDGRGRRATPSVGPRVHCTLIPPFRTRSTGLKGRRRAAAEARCVQDRIAEAAKRVHAQRERADERRPRPLRIDQPGTP
jgi:hypothetical protein